MADLSVAVLVGRLTRDAELKYTNSGVPVTRFSVATSNRRKKGDQWVDEPSFWDVDLWGKQAESLNQYLTKGKLVAVEGNMRQDRWEQDGMTRSKVVINANTVQLLGGGQSGYQSGGQSGGWSGGQSGTQSGGYQGDGRGRQDAPQQWQGQQDRAIPEADEFSDDIPF